MSHKLGVPKLIMPDIDDDGNIVWGKGQEDLPICLLLGDDGLYMRTKTSIFESVVKVDHSKFAFPEISKCNLLKKESGFRFHLPKLPESFVKEAHAFLKASWLKNQSETAILYFFNPTTKEYRPFVPEQEVSSGSIKYEVSAEEHAGMRKEGFILVGTIHSHPGDSAYQSGTDEHDELEIDGWHITLGAVTKRTPTYDARWCISKKSHDCKITEVVEFEDYDEPVYPEEWMNRVKKMFVGGGRRVVGGHWDVKQQKWINHEPNKDLPGHSIHCVCTVCMDTKDEEDFKYKQAFHHRNCICDECVPPTYSRVQKDGNKKIEKTQIAIFTGDDRAKEQPCTIEYM